MALSVRRSSDRSCYYALEERAGIESALFRVVIHFMVIAMCDSTNILSVI